MRSTTLAADREPLERAGDKAWWDALVNAWRLCGVIRHMGEPRPGFRRAMLSTPIIWG